MNEEQKRLQKKCDALSLFGVKQIVFLNGKEFIYCLKNGKLCMIPVYFLNGDSYTVCFSDSLLLKLPDEFKVVKWCVSDDYFLHQKVLYFFRNRDLLHFPAPKENSSSLLQQRRSFPI